MSEEKMREAFEECVMSLLDTVEPVAWANLHGGFISAKYKETLATGLEKQTYTIPLYSRETDESLLSQCCKEARKEALLEAAEVCVTNRDRASKFNGNHFYRGKEIACEDIEYELRRMAESTMEGEKG